MVARHFEVAMLPTTDNRVRSHTAPEINRRIDAETEQSIRYHAAHPEKMRCASS